VIGGFVIAFSDKLQQIIPFHLHMPGTQIGDVAPFDSVQTCQSCHPKIYQEWRGSMHGMLTRDPLYWSALAISSKFDILRSDWCARCHGPVSWLEGRAQPNGEEYKRKDFFETNCDFCHRMVDAMHPDSSALYDMQMGPPRGYGNAQYIIQSLPDKKRGTRSNNHSPHKTFRDKFLKQSSFCGVCHDQSNPYAADPTAHNVFQATHTYGPAQRTYSEWLLSWFAQQGEAGTCQSCHMPNVISENSLNGRTYFDVAQHYFTGANTFLPKIIPYFLDVFPDVDTVALKKGVERSRKLLRNAALLEISAGRVSDSVRAFVRITNTTGHKLPTGVSARKMWIAIVGFNELGDTVFRSGFFNKESGELIEDAQLKLYQVKLGISQTASALFSVPAGHSGFAALNDSVYFDNRIPPRGFSFSAFQERMAEPVGYHYNDGAYWDVTAYSMSKEVVKISAQLLYQPITKSTIEFLRNENIGNEFDQRNLGQRTYDAWLASGKGVVEIMNEVSATVEHTVPSLKPVRDFSFPLEFLLSQNYPNPFNATTTIDFWISANADVSLVLYDVLGNNVRTLFRERTQGSRVVSVDGNTLESGIYFYALNVNGKTIVKKFVFIK